MIRPDMAKWGHTLSDLRRLATEAKHSRTRERFLALYMIGSERTSAAQWALEIGRTDETVLGWVHTYNTEGPEALYYRRTGGRPPFLSKNRQTRLSQQ